MTIVNAHPAAAQFSGKQCQKCKIVYQAKAFTRNTRSKDNLSPWCKQCRAEYAKLYRAANKEKIKNKQRDIRYKESYGISLDDYNKILENQSNKCACCGTTEPSKSPNKWTNFCVDHCHLTGEVRGLLCNSCNIGIGKLGDNLDGVLNAVSYLSLFHSRKEAGLSLDKIEQKGSIALEDIKAFFKGHDGTQDVQHSP
jgi:cell division protein FtsI/penicillin-binding protein 2